MKISKVNSTVRFTEGDVAICSATRFFGIFQLTPSRKATDSNVRKAEIDLFQLTPSRKATRTGSDIISRILLFQLTPSRKATARERARPDRQRDFNSRLHGKRLQIQIIFAAKHFLFLLIFSKFLILAFLFHLASLRFSLHPFIFPVRISLYFSVYLPFALETCTLCHNI